MILNGYSFRRVFLPDKALAAAGVYAENVLEQLAPVRSLAEARLGIVWSHQVFILR